VVSHPCNKNKYVARMGHPPFAQWDRCTSRSFDSAEVRFAQDDSSFFVGVKLKNQTLERQIEKVGRGSQRAPLRRARLGSIKSCHNGADVLFAEGVEGRGILG